MTINFKSFITKPKLKSVWFKGNHEEHFKQIDLSTFKLLAAASQHLQEISKIVDLILIYYT